MLYFAKREGRNQLDDFPEPFLNQWGANAEAIEACKKQSQKIGQNRFHDPAPQTRGFLTGTYYAAKWRLINPRVTDSIVGKRSAKG